MKSLLAALGKPESLIRHVQDRPGHDRRYAMNYTLASAELGYSPQWSFEQGLADTVRWYLEHEDWIASVESGAYRDFMRAWYGERL